MISLIKTGPSDCGFSDWSGIQVMFVRTNKCGVSASSEIVCVLFGSACVWVPEQMDCHFNQSR